MICLQVMWVKGDALLFGIIFYEKIKLYLFFILFMYSFVN